MTRIGSGPPKKFLASDAASRALAGSEDRARGQTSVASEQGSGNCSTCEPLGSPQNRDTRMQRVALAPGDMSAARRESERLLRLGRQVGAEAEKSSSASKGKQAITYIRKAIGADPDNFAAKLELALVLAKIAHTWGAQMALSIDVEEEVEQRGLVRELQKRPDDPLAQMVLVLLFEEIDHTDADEDRAERNLEKIRVQSASAYARADAKVQKTFGESIARHLKS